MINKYKFFLNLPNTKFPMKANLKIKELEILNKWSKDNLYNLIKKKNKNLNKFILHDGPPYANGNIHLGHAVNKILKDIIIKFKNLSGFYAPFIPGWDCHGLPIEHKIEKKNININVNKFRNKCKKYALSQIKKQKFDFIRLGVIADWEKPYLTMNNNFQSNVIKVLSKIDKKGYIIRDIQPVYWCFSCKSSLAESEIEYYNKRVYSNILLYKIISINLIKKIFRFYKIIKSISILVYTNEIWTLFGIKGIIINPNFTYTLIKFNNKYIILYKKYLDFYIKNNNIKNIKIIGETKGINLEFIKCKFPILNNKVFIVLSNNIKDIKTGFINLIPGHNQIDYFLAKKYNLKINNLVDKNGNYISNFLINNKFLNLFNIDNKIINILKRKNKIFDSKLINILYPHCWRHKEPTIFLSTKQWFINMNHNNLKNKILFEIEKIKWIPKWGKNKIKNLIIKRPNWCISRQRYWGVPIPYIIHKYKGYFHSKNDKLVKKIYKKIKKFGIKYYWNLKLKKFIKNYKKYKKNLDVLEVWFDSGCTHYSVVKKKFKKNRSDLYLEGSDQYRGWFMSSLIISVILNNKSPFKENLTHGFVVDENGKKMSKSLGNVITPNEVINKYGADILRLWVCNTNYKSEMNISEEILNRSVDIYRRIRNTIRYMISNIYDFNYKINKIKFKNMIKIDQWIIHHTKLTNKSIINYYSKYDFNNVIKVIMKFCSFYMSSIYLDIIKDRQYTNKKNSKSRRSSQTAIFFILNTLIRWISPILSFLADEAWSYLPNKKNKYVFTEKWYKKLSYISNNEKFNYDFWNNIFKIKMQINKIIEKQRIEKKINSSLEIKLIFYANKKMINILKILGKELRYIFLISDFEIKNYEKSNNKSYKINSIYKLKIEIFKINSKKCLRCWHFFNKIKYKYSEICNRCFKNIYDKGEKRKYV